MRGVSWCGMYSSSCAPHAREHFREIAVAAREFLNASRLKADRSLAPDLPQQPREVAVGAGRAAWR